ncbi:MAG: AraC family transcriptional regulator [Lachnospiraceae bacterium]|nr:AraC family transcriptional regulator [Lachnospiraceae bacterium]
MDISGNIALFQELIQCPNPVYTWIYDSEGELLSSNCPQEALFSAAFSIMGSGEQMIAHGQNSNSPMLLGTAVGMNWGAAFEREGDRLSRCYVIGPVVFSEISLKEAEYGFEQYARQEVGLAWKHRFFRALLDVPLAQHMILSRYTLMLHYCLTGERLDVSDLTILSQETPGSLNNNVQDRHSVWRAEQAMLQMVRDGDLNYKSALNASIMSSNGVPVHGRDPLRQSKTSSIVFASLVCRAAMEGGLSPDEAYSLGNYYIQSAESASSLNDLSTITLTMYDDFIRRVHQCRTSPDLSEQIQKCCDYIEMHLDQKLQAADLARLAGYTEYYFTFKFKKETGLSVNEYMKRAKIQRARVLLLSGDADIRQIAEELGFSSRSYFTRVFTEEVGCTPSQFRSSRGRRRS